MKISRITPILNNSPIRPKNNFNNYSDRVNFSAAIKESKFFYSVKKFFSPVKKLKNKLETKLAFAIAKVLENKHLANFIKKTRGKVLWSNMTSHFLALTSIVLSGFYVKKTLENDKLDPQKRNTLAINQAIVCILSIISAYIIDGRTNKMVNNFIDKYMAVNAKIPYKNLAKDLYKYKDGITAAKKIMIFGVISRFISPVFATPLANYIGNKLQEKKEVGLANK